MHLAAQYGALGCLRLLLDRGADPTITDGAYRSPSAGPATASNPKRSHYSNRNA